MERLLEILNDIKEDIDYEKIEDLVDGEYLDSFDILQIISEVEDEYGISVPASEINLENFNSVKGLWDMIQRLR